MATWGTPSFTSDVADVADLRTYLGAGSAVTDASLGAVLDATVSIVTPLLKAGTALSVPAVKQLVLAAAAQVWRNQNAGGTVSDYGDLQVSAGAAVNSSLLRRYYVLAMPYLNVAGWVG